MRQSEFSDWQNNMAGLRSWFAIMCVILMAEEMRACQCKYAAEIKRIACFIKRRASRASFLKRRASFLKRSKFVFF